MSKKKHVSEPVSTKAEQAGRQVLAQLRSEFGDLLSVSIDGLESDAPYLARCQALAAYLSKQKIRPLEVRTREFLGQVNWKFRTNADNLGVFFATGARHKVTFNYHQKAAIQRTFDRCQLNELGNLLRSFGVSQAVVDALIPEARCVSGQETAALVRRELADPSKLRIEVGERNVAAEILKALFASYLWVTVPSKSMHQFFDAGFSEERYSESFWDELQHRSPRLFHRDNALDVVYVTTKFAERFDSLSALRSTVLATVQRSYSELNNYGHLAVFVEPFRMADRDASWELAADIILFAEKHLERRIDKGYFRPERVADETMAHTPELDREVARFDLANEGFTYRDCFVLLRPQSSEPTQLLVFQKNHRDETVVPCPTCRSSEVEGNSYPSLGVKSWECRNLLCPDRSKYNRGKRYSFRGLAMQQAIDDDRNGIDPAHVRRWQRDVCEVKSLDEPFQMLVRHYSIWGDGVRIIGADVPPNDQHLGRSLVGAGFAQDTTSAIEWFSTAAFFRRYGVRRDSGATSHVCRLGDDRLTVFHGDSRAVLCELERNSIDVAVTSPPYYNAREYSQWPNLYCYLQDMFDVNEKVFRVMKPGALYYYNIFDYFDNENIVAFSAMGNKRLPLSAYTVDLFRRIGFECVGNVVWDKGDIEGKRGFNAGNFAPFYQSPFNCWEHVLVFRKPGNVDSKFDGSRVLRAKPVMKMVKGENVHGHTAPFPPDLPLLAVKSLPIDSLVLDPFGGSLTTGRVAVRNGLRSICVEQSLDYCELGLRMYDEERNEPALPF